MKKGLIDIARFYSTGIGLIYLIYVVFGNSTNSAFSVYHYGIVVLYFSSFIWLIISFNRYFLKQHKSAYNKITLLINAIILFNFTLWMYIISK